MSGWRLAFRMALREARASLPKFLFVVFGVAAGVGALTGVRGFSASFFDALRREARTLMAADLSVRIFAAPTPPQEEAMQRWMKLGAQRTQILELVSMLGRNGQPPALVSVKAIDPHVYPFYGQVQLEPPQPLREALSADAIGVSDDLMVRFQLAPGDTVKLGDSLFRVVGVVRMEPDRMTGSLNVGPRVLVSQEGLERSGLLAFGSRSAQRFLFKLPPQGIDVTRMRADLRQALPEALIADFTETHPAITRALNRSTTFLSLVSLIALIVGALGVATAIHAHIQQRLDSVAILKCLGASSAQIIRIYTLQTALLGLAGGLAGLAVGAGVQRLFPLLLSRFFQFTQGTNWSPAFAVEGVLTGMLVSLLFTLPPLLSVRKVKPALIFRREMPEMRPPWRVRVRHQLGPAGVGLLILAGLGGVAAWLAESVKMGLYFAGGLTVSLLLLGGVAWLLLRGVRWVITRSRLRMPMAARYGLANLYRPGTHAASVLVALGVGVMFTLTVYLVQKSLLREVAGAAPPNAPNVFLINVTEREREGVQALLDAETGERAKDRAQIVPLVQARLVSINGQPMDRKSLRGFSRRFFQTRQVTWVERQPQEVQIRQGQWFDAGTPAVSLSEDAARTLEVKPGDMLRWWSTGREFDVQVSAVHRIQSVQMGPSSEFLFSKAALSGLPAQYVGGLRIPRDRVTSLQKRMYERYPTVTVINFADVLAIVQDVVDQVSLVVQFISGFAILAGAIILASTVAGTRFRRMRETAVLKTLGARRGRLIGIFSAEFAVLGAVAGLLGSLLATAFSRLLMTRLLDAPFQFDWRSNLFTVLLTALLAVGAGWTASLRILNQKPLEVLRDE